MRLELTDDAHRDYIHLTLLAVEAGVTTVATAQERLAVLTGRTPAWLVRGNELPELQLDSAVVQGIVPRLDAVGALAERLFEGAWELRLVLSVAKGSSWDFRVGDPDPHPSVPHGHRVDDRRQKLDAYLGYTGVATGFVHQPFSRVVAPNQAMELAGPR